MAEFPWAVVRPMGEAVSAKGEVVPPGPMEELLAGFPVTAVRLMGEAVPAGVMPPGPMGGALLAEFPVPLVRLMGGAVSARGEVVPPGPTEELLAGFPVTAVRLMGEAVPAGVMPPGPMGGALGRRGGMGMAVPLVKKGSRLPSVPLTFPTPQNSRCSAFEAAPCCCALDKAACALSFAFICFLM